MARYLEQVHFIYKQKEVSSRSFSKNHCVGEQVFFLCFPHFQLTMKQLWVSASVKRQSSIIKGNEIMRVFENDLFSTILDRIYPTDEENIEVCLLKR